MGIFSAIGTMCYSLFVGILLTLLYWYVLYHTTWAYPVAIFSIVFFGLSTIMHVLSAILGLVTICATGTIALVSLPVGGPISCLVIAIVGLFVTFIVAFQFGVAIWGLVMSINLLNSGAQTCPVHYYDGIDCGWLVVLFALTVFTGVLKSRKVESPGEEIQPIHEGEQRQYTYSDGSRMLVNTFVFNPRSAAGYHYPTPTAPPPPYSA
ncbi:hypothetical protein DdX_14774 [Ditylenchus destructor]|uniref:Uncharacterized protein n=1 Tax=Ditylenchus destructor TaxID=166010 RepID=A0AAD4MRA8_9BILA|nr:hypothetical protein DdX_14774 [Ditylenchus destructor]